MLAAVIFDFDGVISDSEPWHFEAYNRVLAEFGLYIEKEEYYAYYLGFTDYEAFEQIQKKYKTDFHGLDIEHLVERKEKIFEEIIGKGGHLIKGIVELIKELKRNNIKTAICSGATAADIKVMLAGTPIENSFDVIVSADDITESKPDPQGYKLTLKKLNDISKSPITALQCVVIEDSHWGITSAQKAGMPVIALTSSYSAGELEDADMIIDFIDELKIDDIRKLCPG